MSNLQATICVGEEIVEISTDHEPSPIVYTVWRDIRAVCVTSCTFPGHSEATVSKMKKNQERDYRDQ